jgi:hypothetical protein
MKTPSTILVTFLTLLTLSSVLASPRSQEARQDSEPARVARQLSQLDWLAGSWEGDMWGGRFHAFYSTPAGGKVLSHSRLVQQDKVVFYEFEVFEAGAEAVVLRPFPGGERAVELTLVELDASARKATFENPEKDYPTRITYQRVTDDRLEILLSDPHGGSDKVERFELSRPETGD